MPNPHCSGPDYEGGAQIIAVFDEHEAPNTNEDAANVIDHSSPDPFEAELSAQRSAFQPLRGEIDVTSSALKI
ncbi:hypothetical protein XELAEV_180449502mg, partial [Xenopus laevis]